MSPFARYLRDIVTRNRSGRRAGVFSVCSAHPAVLEAAMIEARRTDSVLCIESTSNQVNQFGGYTGMKPADFVSFVHGIAARTGFPTHRLLLGGDHLGPFPWRGEPASAALEKAAGLVRACVEAGYAKIHLDASMSCADDPGGASAPLHERTATERTALLCSIAESAQDSLLPGSPEPCYVIGTEVPVPGGEQSGSGELAVTRVEDLERTLTASRLAFTERSLSDAWDRVIAVVVQPGVEFGDATVIEYDRSRAKRLTSFIEGVEGKVYEAHSTDYQTPERLCDLVEDHFAVLKVGPWLTFAFREAVFALESIETEMLPFRQGLRPSNLRRSLEEAMVRNPGHWRPYYSGNDDAVAFARKYSYSDRSRYYWPQREVRESLATLYGNLEATEIPLSILSQYLPAEYEAAREGTIEVRPGSLVREHIARVIRIYARACTP
jgi:D-tagatose-1,6-bisphosphate aldolase subunit GatZ/KbaZ